MTTLPKRLFSLLKSGWYVWLFPALAIIVCVSLLYSYWRDRGPSIVIRFEDVTNIQVEKTKIRLRGVDIGSVNEIAISKDNEHVIVRATLRKDAQHVAVEGTKFWIVTPKVDLQGMTGMETIFTGNYIAVDPGDPNGKLKRVFKGQIGRQTGDSLENTVAYYLETNILESVSLGDHVTFRGLKVGSVSKVALDRAARKVIVQINIERKYVRLIRTNTVFWRKTAIQAKLGLFNSQIKISSLESLLHSGVDFFIPDNPGRIAKALSRFVLLSAPPKGWEKWNPNLEIQAEASSPRL